VNQAFFNGTPADFVRLLESTTRTLARDPALNIDTPDGVLEHPSPDALQRAALRGSYDAQAMKACYHDAALHAAMSPTGPLSRSVYDALEKLRIEALAAGGMVGIAQNLAAFFDQQFAARGLDFLTCDAATPKVNAAVLMVRECLIDQPVPNSALRLVERWRDAFSLRSSALIQSMCTTLDKQMVFGQHALGFIESLELVDTPEKGQQARPVESVTDAEATEVALTPVESGAGDGNDETEQQDMAGHDGGPALSDDDTQRNVTDKPVPTSASEASASVIPFTRGDETDIPPVSPANGSTQGMPESSDGEHTGSVSTPAYHAYTTRFDVTEYAGDMLDKQQRLQLREQLDHEISQHRQMAVKLAARLQNSLKTLQKRAWSFDLDDGLLDTTRLARLVVSPFSTQVYKQERDSHTRDTVVTFLIDNSGSMRGRPIELAAMFTQILAQALERCRVSTEILGFTTSQWRGGQTSRAWRADGKPVDPGRLSDLRHIIYKQADEPWRKARQSLGVMLWPELLKENIDGEALLWAHRRISARPEQHRILVVISDGVAADDATLSANASDYLDVHLRRVIGWIESRSEVELLAIGIGHDVSQIYQRSVAITDSEQLGDAMAHEIIELLGRVPVTARQAFAISH